MYIIYMCILYDDDAHTHTPPPSRGGRLTRAPRPSSTILLVGSTIPMCYYHRCTIYYYDYTHPSHNTNIKKYIHHTRSRYTLMIIFFFHFFTTDGRDRTPVSVFPPPLTWSSTI